MELNDQSPTSREERFVKEVLQQIQGDKGLSARLRRADNPDTEYQSWELLARYGINLEWESQRLPYTTVVAALARTKEDANGTLPLGQALMYCFEDGRESGPAKARLRRLLACQDLVEVTRILRGTLSLIESKINQPLDYIRLLQQLNHFHFDAQKVKAQWAQEFYRKSKDDLVKEDA